MTELLYQVDSYLQEFTATITAADPGARAVLLDRTAFYPGGGGQPCDFGSLTIEDVAYPVHNVRKQGEQVLHVLGGDDNLPEPGAPVRGNLNWNRRYSLMRTHTAMHILCGVVFRDYGALVTGGKIDPLEGRKDFEFETLRGELVGRIEDAANEAARAALEVRVKILPREEAFRFPDLIRTKINLLPEGIAEVRTVQIVGLDLQADGGSHIRNTAEVGEIKVVDYKSKGAINKRIYIALD